VRWADDRDHGGFYVILDDLLAAVWAIACLAAASTVGLLSGPLPSLIR
jgi:phosphatidylglycerophosphatase A